MIKQNPAVLMKADAWLRVSTGLGKFGVTPSNRERISIQKPKKSNPFDDL